MPIEWDPMLSPTDARLMVRNQQHFNAETEQAAYREIDEAVFSKVRIFEEGKAQQIDEHLTKSAVSLEKADNLATELREKVLFPLMDGAVPTQDMASSYSALARQIERQIQILESLDRQAEDLIAVANSPYEGYEAFMKKWGMRTEVMGGPGLSSAGPVADAFMTDQGAQFRRGRSIG